MSSLANFTFQIVNSLVFGAKLLLEVIESCDIAVVALDTVCFVISDDARSSNFLNGMALTEFAGSAEPAQRIRPWLGLSSDQEQDGEVRNGATMTTWHISGLLDLPSQRC